MNEMLTQVPGISLGVVAGVDAEGRPVVRTGEEGEAIPALVVWMASAPNWSDAVGARVVLGFEHGDETSPIVLGLLDAPKPNPATLRETKPKVLQIESERELVIQCGKAKIAMRADGRIEIRGGHLVSRSTGPNKIKGGSVHIN